MATVFTNVGEFRRGKGNKKTRLGPRINIGATMKYGDTKTVQTPNSIAINKLRKLLEKSNLSKNDRYAYTSLMEQAEQVRFMNMQVLAEVFIYLHNIGNTITAENFNYNAIRDNIDRLLPRREIMEGGIRTKEIPEDELEIMRLRMAATFFRYIRYVTLITDIAKEALEEAHEEAKERGEVQPPIIDQL